MTAQLLRQPGGFESGVRYDLADVDAVERYLVAAILLNLVRHGLGRVLGLKDHGGPVVAFDPVQ